MLFRISLAEYNSWLTRKMEDSPAATKNSLGGRVYIFFEKDKIRGP